MDNFSKEIDRNLDGLFDELNRATKDSPAFIRYMIYKSLIVRAMDEVKKAEIDYYAEMNKMQFELLNMLKNSGIIEESDDGPILN